MSRVSLHEGYQTLDFNALIKLILRSLQVPGSQTQVSDMSSVVGISIIFMKYLSYFNTLCKLGLRNLFRRNVKLLELDTIP